LAKRKLWNELGQGNAVRIVEPEAVAEPVVAPVEPVAEPVAEPVEDPVPDKVLEALKARHKESVKDHNNKQTSLKEGLVYVLKTPHGPSFARLVRHCSVMTGSAPTKRAIPTVLIGSSPNGMWRIGRKLRLPYIAPSLTCVLTLSGIATIPVLSNALKL
jgi:hypothetical protein